MSSDRRFLAALALVFLTGTGATVLGSLSMSDMGELPMAGGWTMSMAWTAACGASWTEAAASFVAMWIAMTAAMMTPAVAPMLTRYRASLGGVAEPRLGRLTALAAAGYALVWTAVGLAVFVLGDALATIAMERPAVARAAPLAGGFVVLAAGLFQFTSWKARQLACCRRPMRDAASPTMVAAFKHGLALGRRCALCCAGPTAALIVFGVMDLRAMALATLAISAERLSPNGARIAQATGAMAVAAGLFLIARAGA